MLALEVAILKLFHLCAVAVSHACGVFICCQVMVRILYLCDVYISFCHVNVMFPCTTI